VNGNRISVVNQRNLSASTFNPVVDIISRNYNTNESREFDDHDFAQKSKLKLSDSKMLVGQRRIQGSNLIDATLTILLYLKGGRNMLQWFS
jgi:hypothetical protein